jgi:hypothetical protein
VEDPQHDRKLASELLRGSIIFLLLLNAVFAGLIFLMFFLGGFFKVFGWVLIVIAAVWDWRGLRQVLRLWRGDLSL